MVCLLLEILSSKITKVCNNHIRQNIATVKGKCRLDIRKYSFTVWTGNNPIVSLSPLLRACLQLSMNLHKQHICHSEKVILFLTDGGALKEDVVILERIADFNEKLGNEVVILTYGIGNGKRRTELSSCT